MALNLFYLGRCIYWFVCVYSDNSFAMLCERYGQDSVSDFGNSVGCNLHPLFFVGLSSITVYIFVHLFSAFELMRAWYAGGTPRLVNAESANNMRFSPLVWSE